MMLSPPNKKGQWLSEPSEQHLSEYTILKILSGAQCPVHVEECLQCKQQLTSMRREKEQLAHGPSPALSSVLDKTFEATPKLSKLRKAWRAYWLYSFPVLAAAGLLLFALTRSSIETVRQPQTIALKGSSVVWVVKRGSVQQEAQPGFAFIPGDHLGFRILSPAPVSPVLLSVNETGRVQLLWPNEEQPAVVIPAMELTDLPISLVLESPLETERLFLILGSGNLSPEETQILATRYFRDMLTSGKGLEEIDSLPIDDIVETRLVSVD